MSSSLQRIAGDFWGGLAAMLVALPSAIAFGTTIFSPLGESYGAYGALAGILGAVALGFVASAVGGAQRLITTPCAPAAAVLSAFALEFTHSGSTPESALLLLVVIGLMSGALQILYGTVGLGRLIKYMPFPVVSGYMTAVGLIIIGSQVPKLLGVPTGMHLRQSLTAHDAWQWQGILVGAVTASAMIGANHVVTRIPAAILALGAGMLAYFGLCLVDASLLTTEGNRLVVGPLAGSGADDGSVSNAFVARLDAVKTLDVAQLTSLLIPALTLSALLSIDTLKTCVVLDAMTRSRHNSNRVLIGQGLGNLAAAIVGGIPGAGAMGPTLVNLTSGAVSRLSGVLEGAFALLAFLLLARFIAWVPIAALATILIIIGVRMIDLHALALCKSRHTVVDFVVVLAVVGVALFVDLIAASGTGIVLAILLFIRGQLSGSIIRRKVYGNESLSKRPRSLGDMRILEERGDQTVILELQGSLFFGTADQLYSSLEPEIKARKYIVLDMHRVQSLDITAAHILEQIRDTMADKEGFLIYSHLPSKLPSGQDMGQYIDQTGIAPYKSAARVFEDLEEAKGWIENRILKEAAGTLRQTRGKEKEETLLELHEIDSFKGRKSETLAALDAHLVRKSYAAGTTILSAGDNGSELFFVRKGLVLLTLQIDAAHARRLYTIGRGAFFGELAFLDRGKHSTNVVALTDVDVFVLSRASLDAFAEEHKRAAFNLFEGLAGVLTRRIRYLTDELVSLEA